MVLLPKDNLSTNVDSALPMEASLLLDYFVTTSMASCTGTEFELIDD